MSSTSIKLGVAGFLLLSLGPVGSCSDSYSLNLTEPEPEYLPWPDLSGSWTVELTRGEIHRPGGGVPFGRCELRGLGLTISQGERWLESEGRQAQLAGEYTAAELVCRDVSAHLPLPEPFGQDSVLTIPAGVAEGGLRDSCPGGTWPLGFCSEPYAPWVEIWLLEVAEGSPAGGPYRIQFYSDGPTTSGMSGEAYLFEGCGSGCWQEVVAGEWAASR
jgi:hypothetical protein